MSTISDFNEEEKGKVLQDLTSNAKQIQDDLLKEILTLNAGTEYLKDFLHGGLHGRSAKELFKKNVPIVTYEDVKPYIDRVVNGEPSNILSVLPITNFLLTSGTSAGASKMIPSNIKFLEGYAFIGDLILHVINKHVKGVEKGKGMLFFLTSHDSRTPIGLPMGSATSWYLKSDYFKNRPSSWYYSYTSPDEVILGSDSKQVLYCHLLCGLVQRDEVMRIGSIFASIIVRVIKLLEDSWKELCWNIRSGHLSEWITDSGCRNSVSIVLGGQPRPELSDEIEKICSEESWEGSMAQYVPTLNYYCNDLPLVSTAYASSESVYGININPLSKPEDVSYTLLPNLCYFEFIPLEGDDNDVVDLVDVTGFYNKAPQFKVVGRENVVLSIETDMTKEEDLFKAVNQEKLVLNSSGLRLVHFTSSTDISSSPGHYVIYWEVKAENKDIKGLEFSEKTFLECCLAMEDSLDEGYKYGRVHGTIGPLEIRVSIQDSHMHKI
ncbi:unnamed protein product [Eruca vesicaria subsp. sativa]|uniref:GH3 C-terminal domain-containing protein n=1 Tax=Eruca vesicaria subsp. sativa TaxID=29727 RepID=A0ABC8LBG2_ERUVS|nr:unnamed protein product [Eruca vesicaria subsp. sativa]